MLLSVCFGAVPSSALAMTLVLALLLALVLEYLVGEPKRAHPLVGFGHWVKWLERYCWKDSIAQGVLTWAVALLPGFVLGALYLSILQAGSCWYLLIDALGLWFALGYRSLQQHLAAIVDAPDVAGARAMTQRIVSRDMDGADESAVASAAVESGLENGADAVFAPLFWFLLGGGIAAALYRLCNTLDAMWGYRNTRYERFGKWAARCDDVLNLLPSQCNALAYALLSSYRRAAITCWWRQGWAWKSPAAGSVMAAGAAGLGLALGGPAVYHGELQHRAQLGEGRSARLSDISHCQGLLRRCWYGYLLLILAVLISFAIF